MFFPVLQYTLRKSYGVAISTRQVNNGAQTSNLSQQQQKHFWSKMIFNEQNQKYFQEKQILGQTILKK